MRAQFPRFSSSRSKRTSVWTGTESNRDKRARESESGVARQFGDIRHRPHLYAIQFKGTKPYERERERDARHSFIRTRATARIRARVRPIHRPRVVFICRLPSPPRVRSDWAPWDTSGSTFIVTRDRRPFIFVSDVRAGHPRVSRCPAGATNHSRQVGGSVG